MKKKNIIGIVASALSLVVFALSFAVRAVITDRLDGHFKKVVFYNSVWGSTEFRAYEDGKLWKITQLNGGVSPFPIIGFILILIIGIIAVQTIIFNKQKSSKWILLSCGIMTSVSSTFQLLGGDSAIVAYAKCYNTSTSSVREMLRESEAIAWAGTLGVILAVLTIVIGVALVLTAFLPEDSKEKQ